MRNPVRFLTVLSALSCAVMVSPAASAADFLFDTDPFAGTNALTTPGRQIVGGEPFITFDVATDTFVFDQAAFAVGSTVSFASDFAANLPTSGLNVIVLQDLDNDADVSTPFAAGTAANLLANRITADGAGFFIYFNSGLGTPRLVYSTNLSEADSDLAILARLTNLAGNPAALASFTSGNFAITSGAVPEPATWAMLLLGFGLVGGTLRSIRRQPKAGVLPA